MIVSDNSEQCMLGGVKEGGEEGRAGELNCVFVYERLSVCALTLT